MPLPLIQGKESLMRRFFILSIFPLILAGCSFGLDPRELQEDKISLQLKNQPEWYQKPPKDGRYVYAAGTSGLPNIAVARTQARQDALVNLTRSISETVEAMSTTSFSGGEGIFGGSGESTFQEVSKLLSEARLSGVELMETKNVSSGVGVQTYVLIRVPKSEVSKAAAAQLATVSGDQFERHQELLDSLDEALDRQ